MTKLCDVESIDRKKHIFFREVQFPLDAYIVNISRHEFPVWLVFSSSGLVCRSMITNLPRGTAPRGITSVVDACGSVLLIIKTTIDCVSRVNKRSTNES